MDPGLYKKNALPPPPPTLNPLSFKYPVICVDVHIGLTFYITQSRHLEIL